MTNEAIEAAARAIAELCEVHDNWQDCIPEARAAAPALMEAGARLALEAAEYAFVAPGVWTQPWKVLRKLDPAAIVKGAGHDRD